MARTYTAKEVAAEARVPEKLIAERTRAATIGWVELLDERVAAPARERMLTGELDRFPDEARVAFVAQPGEVLATDAVVEAAHDGSYRFVPLEEAYLKGVPEPVPQFRVTRGGAPRTARP